MQWLDLRELAESLKGCGYDSTGVMSIPSVVFWITRERNLVNLYQYFGGIYGLYLQGRRWR
jgi:hypothetical protein